MSRYISMEELKSKVNNNHSKKAKVLGAIKSGLKTIASETKKGATAVIKSYGYDKPEVRRKALKNARERAHDFLHNAGKQSLMGESNTIPMFGGRKDSFSGL